MTMELLADDRHIRQFRVLCTFLLLSPALASIAAAQDDDLFDPFAAGATLDEISAQLSAEIVTTEFLTTSRTAVIAFGGRAEDCRTASTAERGRLEARFEPLRNVDAEVAPAIFDQRTEVRRQLDEAIARQSQCNSVKDLTDALLVRITETQNQLSQQFLSNRGESVIALLLEMPNRIQAWPMQVRGSVDIELVDDVTPAMLFWALIAAGLAATALGVWLRHRFNQRYTSAGGDDMPPEMKYLFPKPLAEYSPLLLIGLALATVLYATIPNNPLELAVVRIATSFLLLGLGFVLIDWSTGPLSPSARVKGLIPDHVQPLRLRLRFFIVTLVASFVFLGTEWLAISRVDPNVSGRSTMIALVAISLIYVLGYLGRIPGVAGRIRLIRYVGSLTLLVGVIALLIGYQNFAGYLVHGVTRTLLALAILWILLWVGLVAFDFLASNESSGAAKLRASLGMSQRTSQTSVGFIQLIADLVIWIGFLVYLIYVWDESGTTLDRLFELVIFGGTVGNIQLVPLNIILGILVFTGLLIVIGWTKRWIDRRWLQHLVIERGAREALITLLGYVGFIFALLIGLTQAGVELGGLVWISTALALGIGFGMQEIANNFVSGLILLFERPIRAGDFVTVGDVDGFVRSIRIRATEIESLDNQNILVPNSQLISGRVTNWVLRDTYGRVRLNVGVAYGSDVEVVRDILEVCATEHPEVITDGRAPGPRALFMSFGDSSLNFELRVRINRIDRRFSVISDLNFAINAAFREANIVIPFPQRDLHLISLPEQRKPVIPVAKETEEDGVGTGVFQHLENITRSHREEISIDVGIADAWNALTDIEAIKKWLATDGQFTARIGGQFSLALRDGTNLSGRIDIYLPPRRMRLVVALRDGDELPASGPTTIEFALFERKKKTRVSVSVTGIPATEEWEEDYRRSEDRWHNGMADLLEYLSHTSK